MVFQQFCLFPHLTALKSGMFGPQHVRGLQKAEAKMLAKVGLAGHSHNYPSELPGGQQQRVAVAMPLAVKPKMMPFDKPPLALNAK